MISTRNSDSSYLERTEGTEPSAKKVVPTKTTFHSAEEGELRVGWVGEGRDLSKFPGRGVFGEKGLGGIRRHSWWEEGVLFT